MIHSSRVTGKKYWGLFCFVCFCFVYLFFKSRGRFLAFVDPASTVPTKVTRCFYISAQTFSSVKRKLRSCSQEWMQGFLDNEGLERLLDCVDTLALKRVTVLSDALVLIECVECIKAVLNSRIGLSLLVERPEYCRRLIKGENNDVLCNWYY